MSGLSRSADDGSVISLGTIEECPTAIPSRCAGRSVVHVASFSPEYGGNFVESLRRLRENCGSQGDRWTLILPGRARSRDWVPYLVESGWRVDFFPPKASTTQCTRLLYQVVTQTHAQIVHTHFTEYDPTAWMAVKWSRLLGRRHSLVWHIHSEPALGGSTVRRAKNLLKYRVLGHSVWMISVGDSVAEKAVMAGVPADRIFTIPSGIELGRATSAVKTRSQVLFDLRLPEEKQVVLMFGTDPLNKGVDIALEAMRQVCRRRDDLALVIVGRDATRSFIARWLGKESRPEWLRVTEPHTNVADLYGAASIFLSASRSEGQSYAALEAMANGLPVIFSDIAGVAWAHRCSGSVFFQSADSANLAASLCSLLDSNSREKADRSSTNQTFASREYDLDAWTTKINDCYRIIRSEG